MKKVQFPLLSKCVRLQRVCAERREGSHVQIVQLPDFPGGVDAFEVCAKFCYGITITVSAYNIVPIRCAAEYLQMTEDVDKGNLIYKIQVFFTSCILHGWRDTIVTLQTTKAFPPWSEDLGITSRCVEAIASKVVGQSRSRGRDDISLCNGKGWWGEDLAELEIDLYWRTIIGIKSGGRVAPNLIGDALRIYASRWLPKQVDFDSELASKYRLLLESIVSLLPCEKGQVSCSFLLKLLKAVNILKASPSSKTELARKIAAQLEEASVSDLLIPSQDDERMYDVDVVITILEYFTLQGQTPPTTPPRNREAGFERRRRSRSAENVHGLMFQEGRRSSSASHSTKLKVAKLVDGYLQKIAKDKNLALSKFIAIAEAIPAFARPDHDDLYKAIDTYLKVFKIDRCS